VQDNEWNRSHPVDAIHGTASIDRDGGMVIGIEPLNQGIDYSFAKYAFH
jgi:hypothetical protein